MQIVDVNKDSIEVKVYVTEESLSENNKYLLNVALLSNEQLVYLESLDNPIDRLSYLTEGNFLKIVKEISEQQYQNLEEYQFPNDEVISNNKFSKRFK